ncbi:MAG TPA: 3'-5' exonuclease [Nitrospirota bacterium]|nr:3'-5' exonuclease [Nitrospirota bacterium]
MFSIFGRKRKFPGIDLHAAIAESRYVVIDTELTGLDEKRDAIVSLGAVRMTGGVIELGTAFHQLVSPGSKLTSDSVVIHEITPSDLEAQPAIDAALGAFLEFCGSDVLVGHFISIDLAFLNREMKRTLGRELANPAVDTFSMYEWLRKRSKSRECFATPLAGYRLYDLAKCFDVPVGNAHNAMMDAFTTAQLFQRFLPLAAESGAVDIDDLLQLGTPFKGGDNFRLTNEFGNF